jgi:hypothetical protein
MARTRTIGEASWSKRHTNEFQISEEIPPIVLMRLRDGQELDADRLEPRWQLAWHDPSPD